MQNFESVRLSKSRRCEKHHNQIVSICTAPQCFNFRQLCEQCIKIDSHHSKQHINQEKAFSQVQRNIEHLFKGLKALKTKIIYKMETNINSHEGLNEIQQNLSKIKKLINNKIDNFHLDLKRRYEKDIKQKLNDLFLIVERSHQFLQEEKRKLFRTQKLQPFFVNDLAHDLRYYESYFDQILEKNIRKFKKGFEHDKVLKMIVNFEQNLSQIFTDELPGKVENQNHFFSSDDKSHFKIRLQNASIAKTQLPSINHEQGWLGYTPSVYYSPKNCYYTIGEGKRESNKIKKIIKENSSVRVLETKMETKRTNFAACLLNHQIYIVGGQNSKDGCLLKCQKFVPSQGKTYIVNSLNKKSSQHNVCSFRDKFILKFGGTDKVQSLLEESDTFNALPPEIYSLQTEQWRILQFPDLTSQKGRINFGLWPGIFCLSSEHIIIIEGNCLKKKSSKNRFDFQYEFNGTMIKDIKLSQKSLILDGKCPIMNNFWESYNGKLYFSSFPQKSDKINLYNFQI